MTAGTDPTTDLSTDLASDTKIHIRGARTHNLKNIDVSIPRNQLVVITGRSGSGKSSLAFDTVFAEGQRQYMECLSIHSRQFFKQLPKADVDSVTGLQPTISLDQSSRASSSRSTVGTLTEIFDFLRLLMARVGQIHCHRCAAAIEQHSAYQVRDRILDLPERTKIMILAPMANDESGNHRQTIKKIRRERLVRVRIDKQIHDIDQLPEIDASQNLAIDAVTDRIIVREGIESRLLDAIDHAIRIGKGGQVTCSWLEPATAGGTSSDWLEQTFSTRYACANCDIEFAEFQPRSFSFNSPFGACDQCQGLGHSTQFDPDLIVDRKLSVGQGAITAWSNLAAAKRKKNIAGLDGVMNQLNITADISLSELTPTQWLTFLDNREKGKLGLRMLLEKEFATTPSEDRQQSLDTMRSSIQCPSCCGTRLSKQARAVLINGLDLGSISNLPLTDATRFFQHLELEDAQARIAKPLIDAVLHRLSFLENVGLGYLTLGRAANTLSGGEHQRVRLASSIGTGITNACFVLDEPSIGLHQRDNDRLISTISNLRDSGNSVIVVEHDEAMIRQADHVIDMGPQAGEHGGTIVSQGDSAKIAADPNSLTGQYLSGKRAIAAPASRRPINENRLLHLTGATGNNLQSVDVKIPLGVFCCVTGVSGSGKSTLINQTLAPAVARKLGLVAPPPAAYSNLTGQESIDKLVIVDQKPIGLTPRGCPATFTGVFDEIRKLFAATKMAKQRGYGIGRFSFNAKTGWCPECRGHGVKKIAMNFMPDIFATCQSCQGKRFNLQTLQVRFGDLTIADVLALTVQQAIKQFDGFSKIRMLLERLVDVGLGYLRLGQPATTLSGGEAQRIKLGTELAKPDTGNTLYILDEPTTGLHFEDIRVLIQTLNRLVEQGNSMLVIEHNLDVIQNADWIIDLGPEGGSGGGEVLAAGTPEQLAEVSQSHTGRFLAKSGPFA